MPSALSNCTRAYQRNCRLIALDPFEQRYKIVSSVEEGKAAFEQFRMQALRNRLVGAAEAMSLTLDFLSAGDLASVDRNSEQYKLGRNVGTIGSGLSAITPWGLTNLLMKAFGKAGKVAVHQIHAAAPEVKAFTQLDWSIIKQSTGETRVAHVMKHEVDNLAKEIHGIFVGDSVALTKEAWERAQQMGIQRVAENGAEVLYVPMGRQVGWLGGQAGAQTAIPLDTVKIVLKAGTDKLITAFPVF